MQNHIVVQSASKIREVARAALAGYWKQVVIFVAIYYLMVSGVSQVLDLFFTFTKTVPIEDPTTGEYMVQTIGYGSAIYSLLISGPVSYGLSVFLLDFFRDKRIEYGSLFEGFSQFGKAFLLMLIIGVKVFLWSLLLVVPGIIAVFRYSQAYYVMKDHPEYSANQCVEASKVLMQGNKGRYFYLQLTFIGWYILASIPGAFLDTAVSGIVAVIVMFLTSIPVFFVDAYSNVANTVFYELAIDNLNIVEHDDTQTWQ